MSVGNHCRSNPESTSKDASIREAAKQMEATGVGCLVVVDDHGRPGGLVTDRDLVLRGLAPGRNPDRLLVGDVMSPLHAKAREATPVETAVLRMGIDGIRRLPVVDAHGALAGMFTYDDALRLVASQLSLVADAIGAQLPPGVEGPEASWEVPTARRFHQRPVALSPDARVTAAVDEMEEAGTGTVVVVDPDRAPIGILTDRDVLCRVLAVGADAQETHVGDVMSKDVVFSKEDASLQHVLEYAKSRGVRRIPLVDETGRLSAVVSLDDIVAELASELAHLSDAVRREQQPFHHRSLERR